MPASFRQLWLLLVLIGALAAGLLGTGMASGAGSGHAVRMCTTDIDCQVGEHCFRDYCYPGLVSCGSDSACGAQQACYQGACASLVGPCAADGACPLGALCADAGCVVAPIAPLPAPMTRLAAGVIDGEDHGCSVNTRRGPRRLGVVGLVLLSGLLFVSGAAHRRRAGAW